MKANKSTNRAIGGFTMAEMLAVIAIVAIAAALAFVGISQYLRSTYQREMDETAKEIYVAAQNHVVVAESLGAMSGRTAGMDSTHEDTVTSDKDTYYFVVGADGSDRRFLDNKKSLLSAMLPQGSIDETVRSAGSYIIRYRYANSHATVLDVFYADPSTQRFPSYPYTFASGDFATLFGNSSYTDTGSAGAQARADYNGAIIGYYGGDGSSSSADDLDAVPKLKVTNAEKLTATITNASGQQFRKAKLELYIVGKESKAKYGPISIGTSGVDNTFTIDDVTAASGHFADLNTMSFSGGTLMSDEEFIPGEDITVQAFALGTDELSVKKSAKRTTNSLFASLGTTSAADVMSLSQLTTASDDATQTSVQAAQDYYAKISNFRHLENMSQAVSSYDPSALGSKAPVAYEQTADLSWPDFCKKVVGLTEDANGIMPEDTSASLGVQIHSMDGDVTSAHTFRPVDWRKGALDYRGYARKVADVEIDGSDNAGLFGTVSTSSTASIANLELLNFKVATSAGSAGALAGSLSDAAVANVLARDEVDDTAYGVSASGNAGGLVGAMAGGSLTGCAAALYVSGSAAAGGLVGTADNATLQYSYAGGHTTNGTYNGGRYASNVLSGGVAGGFIGSFNSGAAIGCYSTCSASGSAAGYFAGSNFAALSDCYAVGAANGEDWNLTDVYGNALSTEGFDSAIASGRNPAFPYDSTLAATYRGAYSFKTVAEMPGATEALGLASASGATLTQHLDAHYGDWPAIVTLTVNP